MKKHFLRVIMVLLMACLGIGVLAACGDGEEETPPSETTYTVAFSLGEGTENHAASNVTAPTSQTGKKVGDVITLTTPAAATDWKFDGWYAVSGKVSGATYTVKAADAVNGTITLTAHWAADTPAPATIEGYWSGVSQNNINYAASIKLKGDNAYAVFEAKTGTKTYLFSKILAKQGDGSYKLEEAVGSGTYTYTGKLNGEGKLVATIPGALMGASNDVTLTFTEKTALPAGITLSGKMYVLDADDEHTGVYFDFTANKNGYGDDASTEQTITLTAVGAYTIVEYTVTGPSSSTAQTYHGVVSKSGSDYYYTPDNDPDNPDPTMPISYKLTATAPTPPATTTIEGVWTGATATGLFGGGTDTFTATIDLVEGQAHEGYVVLKATETVEGNATDYYIAFGIDKEGDDYKGSVPLGQDDPSQFTLTLAEDELTVVLPFGATGGAKSTTITFTNRNATLPDPIAPSGTLYAAIEDRVTFKFDFAEKKFYSKAPEESEYTEQTNAKFINIGDYIGIESADAGSSALAPVFKSGSDYYVFLINISNAAAKLTTEEPDPPQTYTVKFEAGEHGSVSGSGTTVSGRKAGDTVTFPTLGDIQAAKGYRFKGWYIGSTAVTESDYRVSAEDAVDGTITITAQFEVIKYTVAFETAPSRVATMPDSVQNVTVEDTVGIDLRTKTATCTGYTLTGWDLTGTTFNFTDNYTFLLSAHTDRIPADTEDGTEITLVAQWTAKTYQVTLVVGNGTLSGSAATVEATYGQSITLPTVTANKGYRFDAWYTTETEGGTKYVDEQPWETDEEHPTLYARYNYIEYTVEYAAGEKGTGNVTLPEAPQGKVSLEEGHNTITLSTPGYDGSDKVFDCWLVNGASIGTTGSHTITAADLPENSDELEPKITITAKWRDADKIAVNYNLGDHAANQDVPTQDDVTSGTNITLPDAPTAEKGYRFTGWYVDGSKVGDAKGSYQVKDVQSVTITAQYEAIKYKVQFANGDESVQGSIADEENFTVESAGIDLSQKTGYTRTGYDLTGWTSGSTTLGANATFKLSEHTDLIPEETEDNVGGITLTARWTAKTYTVTLEAGAHGELNGESTVEATYGAALTLTDPTPAAGYTFKGWFTQATAGEQFTSGSEWTTDGEDLKLYAQYEAITYVVKYAPGDAADAAKGMPEEDGSISMESPLTLPTDPTRDGYTFTGWRVEGKQGTVKNSDSPLTLDAAIIAQATDGTEADQGKKVITLTATWTKDPIVYTFNFYENKDDGEAKATKTETLADGVHVGSETVETKIDNKTNYTFDGWYYEKGGEEHEFDATFVPSEYGSTTIKVYAHWTLNDEITVDDITTTNYTGDKPPYVYPEKLKKGEILTLTSSDMQFSAKENSVNREWRGIHFYLTDGEPVEGQLSGNWAMLLYNNFINGKEATAGKLSESNALHFNIVNEYIGFPDTDYWWVESLQEIMKTGTDISLKAVLNFSTTTRIVVEYTVTATFKAWHDGGSGAVQYETEETKNFVCRYYIMPTEGDTLADEYTIAVGGEQASVSNVTLTRTTHTHNYVDDLWCECGELNPEHEHAYKNGKCECGLSCPHTDLADGSCSVCGVKITAGVEQSVAEMATWSSAVNEYDLVRGGKVIVTATQTLVGVDGWNGMVARLNTPDAGNAFFVRPDGLGTFPWTWEAIPYANKDIRINDVFYKVTTVVNTGAVAELQTYKANNAKVKMELNLATNGTLTCVYSISSSADEELYKWTLTIKGLKEISYKIGFANDGATFTDMKVTADTFSFAE